RRYAAGDALERHGRQQVFLADDGRVDTREGPRQGGGELVHVARPRHRRQHREGGGRERLRGASFGGGEIGGDTSGDGRYVFGTRPQRRNRHRRLAETPQPIGSEASVP